ncbi:MAG: hypothetical protein GKR99_19530 [Rhodobacteraceae bacterium]|nr:hypothetical protein [Paracoccaceae bacterium]
MGITEDIADQLAKEAIAAAEKLGDDQLVANVAKVIGATSATTEEAFLTAVRIRSAETRAREYLADRIAGEAPAVPESAQEDH